MGLAAGEGGGGLSQADVAQAHVPHGLQFGLDAGEVDEKLQRLVHGHVEDVGDALAAKGYLQGFPVVAAALADLAGDGDIGQELHLDLVVSIALAGLAAASLHVEGEPARRIAAHPGFGKTGEQVPDGGEGPGVGGRVAPRGAPDGRLVDVHDLVHALYAQELAVLAGYVPALVDHLVQFLVQDLVDQAAFAGTGNAGDADQSSQWEGNVDVTKVVLAGALDQQLTAAAVAPVLGERDDLAAAEVRAGQGVG